MELQILIGKSKGLFNKERSVKKRDIKKIQNFVEEEGGAIITDELTDTQSFLVNPNKSGTNKNLF